MSWSVCSVSGGGSGLEKLPAAAGHVDASYLLFFFNLQMKQNINLLKEPTVVHD